jgi:hypothetical protein
MSGRSSDLTRITYKLSFSNHCQIAKSRLLVTDWAVASSEKSLVVFLALEYVDNEAQLQAAQRSQLQATLSPAEALEIAEALTKAAGKLLGPSLPPGKLLQ